MDKKLWDGKDPYKPCFVPEINRYKQIKFSKIILKVLKKEYLESITRNKKRWLLLTLINSAYYINEIVFQKKSRERYIVEDDEFGFISTSFLSKEELAKRLRRHHQLYAHILIKCFNLEPEKLKELWEWMYKWENYKFDISQKYDPNSNEPFSFYRERRWRHLKKYDRGI